MIGSMNKNFTSPLTLITEYILCCSEKGYVYEDVTLNIPGNNPHHTRNFMGECYIKVGYISYLQILEMDTVCFWETAYHIQHFAAPYLNV